MTISFDKTVIKVMDSSGGFVSLPRAFAQDHSISPTTRSALLDTFSRPETWKTTVAGLMTINGFGRDVARRVLSEAEAAGYAANLQIRDGGKFGSSQWFLCADKKIIQDLKREHNVNSPEPEIQAAVNDTADGSPGPESQGLENSTYKEKEEQSKEGERKKKKGKRNTCTSKVRKSAFEECVKVPSVQEGKKEGAQQKEPAAKAAESSGTAEPLSSATRQSSAPPSPPKLTHKQLTTKLYEELCERYSYILKDPRKLFPSEFKLGIPEYVALAKVGMEMWNHHARRLGLDEAAWLTKKRMFINASIKMAGGLDGFLDVLENLDRGQLRAGDRWRYPDWKLTFEDLCDEGKFTQWFELSRTPPKPKARRTTEQYGDGLGRRRHGDQAHQYA
jgi:hypothetical protein